MAGGSQPLRPLGDALQLLGQPRSPAFGVSCQATALRRLISSYASESSSAMIRLVSTRSRAGRRLAVAARRAHPRRPSTYAASRSQARFLALMRTAT